MRYPDRERRRIATLQRRRSELGEVLSFLERVADAAERLVPEGFDLSRLRQPVDGEPPLLPSRFSLDESAAAEAFQTLLEALVEVTGSGAAKAALAAMADGRLDAHRLVRAYCAADATAFEAAANLDEELEAELLANLAELAVKPQFIAAARVLKKEAGEAPDRSNRCPACGSYPHLALITDRPEAERLMLAVCRLCESEWPISRIRCLHCGNEDSETLSYLQVEGEEEARVNICDVCNRYLPILDVRGRLEVAPAIERAALAHLEIIAQSRGGQPLSSPCKIGVGVADC